MDTCRTVTPELPDRYRSITPWGCGEIGSRAGLKIRWPLAVWVRVPPSLPNFFKITVAFFENMSYNKI
jgi:hypothetical protein